MPKLCADCKHWERFGERIHEIRISGDIFDDDAEYEPSGLHECRRITWADPQEPGVKACMDGIDCNGDYVYTAPDFGCVLWEEAVDVNQPNQ